MALWDDPLAVSAPGPAAPPTAPVPAASPSAPPSAVPVPQSSAAFRIPFLGPILDTARDLVVGPGNENLTTQEQVTRAILNTIVLAKAPQSLGAVYGNNQARDMQSFSTMADPRFQTRVDQLIDNKVPEADAIRQAAREYQIDTGIALPTTKSGLPPMDPAAQLKYAGAVQRQADFARASSPVQKNVGPGISPEEIAAAQTRPILGNAAQPGDAAILASLDKQATARVADPSQPIIENGQRIDPVTRQVIGPAANPEAPTALASAPLGTPPTTGITNVSIPPPGTPGEPKPLTPAEVQKGPEIDPAAGVSSKKWVTEYNAADKKDVTYEVDKTPAELAADVKSARDAVEKVNQRMDAGEQKHADALAKAVDDESRVQIMSNVLQEELKSYIENDDGSPRYDVFTIEKPYKNDVFGYAQAAAHKAKEMVRASSLGQMVEGNDGVALFSGQADIAGQIFARVITKDRVTQQDYVTFRNALPTMGMPRELAAKMIDKIPQVVQGIYDKIVARETKAREKLNARREGREVGAAATPTPRPTSGPAPAAQNSSLDKFRSAFPKAGN